MIMVLCEYLNTINFVVKDVRGTLLITLQKDYAIQAFLCGKHCIVRIICMAVLHKHVMGH